jgi:hypothetical protein
MNSSHMMKNRHSSRRQHYLPLHPVLTHAKQAGVSGDTQLYLEVLNLNLCYDTAYAD